MSPVNEHVVQWHEVVTFLVVIVGYLPIIVLFLREHAGRLFLAYTALVIGTGATILEAVMLPRLLNGIEHGVGVFLAGALFLYAAYGARQRLYTIQHPGAEGNS